MILIDILNKCSEIGWWNIFKISFGVAFVTYAFFDMKNAYKRMLERQEQR